MYATRAFHLPNSYEVGQYDQTQIQDQPYWVAWKSIETGRQDKVTALTDQSNFPTAVGFKTLTGEQSTLPGEGGNEKQVLLTGKVAKQSETLTAYVKVQGQGDEQEQEMEVGRLNVITYDKVLKHLVIVPVNDASAQDVTTELNRIYAQAVAEWDVTIDQPFNIEPNYLSCLDEGESGMLASFPARMREFNRPTHKHH